MTTPKRNIPIKKILTIAALSIAVGLSLLLLCLAFLPTLVSSQSVQTRIQKNLSSSLKRQVAWSKLAISWTDGLALSGLKLGDGPAPLLKADIEQLVITPGISRGTDGRFGVDLAVKIKNVQAELAPGPPKAVPPPTKDPLTLLAEMIQKVQGLDFPLPVDLRIKIEIAPLQVRYRVPVPGKQLQLDDFSLRLAMPSLATKPVVAEVNGRVVVDGRDMGKVNFNAKVSDLVTNERRIHLTAALFTIDAAAPGTSLAVTGGLGQVDGFTARLKLDLPRLLAVAHPFVPPAIPELAGSVELLLQAKADAERNLHATVTLEGVGLAAHGGVLKAKRVGSLDLKLQQQIVTNHTRQRVEFPGGTCVIPELFTAAWSASVNHPTVPARSLDLQVGPLRLDLARARAVATPFLPPDTPVKDLSGELTLRSLNLKLTGPGNNGDLAVAGFGVKLPHLRAALKKGEVTAADVELLLEKVSCPLVAKLPVKLAADLLWRIKSAALSGAQPLSIQGASGAVGVVVSDLNLKSASPRNIAASAVITQSVDLDRISSGTQFTVEKVHEQLRFLTRAAENGDIEATLPEFSFTAASLQGKKDGKRFGPLPLTASLTATNIHLSAAQGAKPTLKHAAARISAGEAVQVVVETALYGASPQRATTSGTARLDLRRTLPVIKDFLPSGMKGDGVVSAAWDLAALLPDKALAADTNPLRSARVGLSLFDKLELSVKLDTVSATVPSATGTINVAGLHTGPDLRVVSTNRGESARFEGGLRISAVSGLPGSAGKLPPQHGSFVFDGHLTGWREFRLSEALRIDPLAVVHEAELNVSRIDTLLDEKQPFSVATLIKRLDATLLATVEGEFTRDLKPLLPGIDLAGTINSAVRVDLAAGRDLAVRCSLATRDLGAQLANGTKIEGVRSDIAINRSYSLAVTPPGEHWTPLSTALVRPAVVATANPGAAGIVGRIHDDLRGDVGGARSFSIKRITTKTSGVPLVLTALEGDLLFSQEKTGISFFQGDLLGGTLLARSVFDLKPEVPVLAAASSFSNLDVTYLLPKDAKKQQTDQDAEITGELSFTAPLTPEQRELFEQLRLAVNIRKIGANTLERALFTLDPYERNEQLVAQRKMLRLGRLKGLRATAVDGAFSMEGEAEIKGVAVELPNVDRVRISELPLRQELVKSRGKIMALRGFLDLVRADTVVVGPKGELTLKRGSYEK
jgi:translocation and assembly module TamB